MSGGNRIHFPGAIYHVVNRGNNKADIFFDDKDYNVFLKQLNEVKQSKDFDLYSYCLMPNHFHLLIEVNQQSLSKIMQCLLTAYVMYFNSRYKRVGHLFQSRYKAIVCGKEEYLLRLVRYIHLNPVRAKMVKNINDYKWSSHQYYINKAGNKKLSVGKIFCYTGSSFSEGYKTYNNIMNEEYPEELEENFKKAYKSRVLGSDNFVKKIVYESMEPIVKKETLNKLSLSEILNKILSKNKLSKDLFLSRSLSPLINKARKIFVFIAAKKHAYAPKEISDFIGRDVSVIRKYIREIEKESVRPI